MSAFKAICSCVKAGIAPLRGIGFPVHMSSVPSFVSELVRAANEVDRLNAHESEHLLLRAVTTIRDLREIIGIPVYGTELDAVIKLNALASATGQAAMQEIRDGLLEAADMVRTLWIVVDSGTEISWRPWVERTERREGEA
ncbi:hypothetical protein [Rhizobium sp. S163]|uniref:hypothetical protein n=1 Tax=Rhizobium sp. S163 TaxID=3055039 RepID=UPI0025A9F4DF|nr:hypothetical protein [Rhizobium sp. S163]MDM9648257.1 hypothetical protein [Rhizobium sp. S163]